MLRVLSVVLSAGVLSLPVQADTIGEEKSLKINRINQTDFEVLQTRGLGASEYWCGAASYTIRRQGLPGGTEIYLKRGLAPSVTTPNARSVVFSYSAQGLSPSKSSIWTISQVGAVFRSTQALRLCRDAFTRSTK